MEGLVRVKLYSSTDNIRSTTIKNGQPEDILSPSPSPLSLSLSLSLSLLENIRVLEFRKTRNARKSMFYEGAETYNSLPARIKQCDRLEIFERVKRVYLEYNTIFLVTLIDLIIISLAFRILYFVFYILYLQIAEKAQ